MVASKQEPSKHCISVVLPSHRVRQSRPYRTGCIVSLRAVCRQGVPRLANEQATERSDSASDGICTDHRNIPPSTNLRVGDP